MMHFYKNKGKQILNLQGNLILTHNEDLISVASKSAGPTKATNAQYFKLKGLRFRGKVRATFSVIGFIWGKSQELKADE